MHIKEKELADYVKEIQDILDYSIAKQFSTVILPAEEEKLLIDLEKTFAENEASRQLEKITIRKRKETTDVYKKIIAGYKESLSLVRKFTERIN